MNELKQKDCYQDRLASEFRASMGYRVKFYPPKTTKKNM